MSRTHSRATALICLLSLGGGCGHVQTTINSETTSTLESWRPEVLPPPDAPRVYDHLEIVTHDAVRAFDNATYTRTDAVLQIRGRGPTDLALADIALSDIEAVRGTRIEHQEGRHVKGHESGWTAAGVVIGLSFLMFLVTAMD